MAARGVRRAAPLGRAAARRCSASASARRRSRTRSARRSRRSRETLAGFYETTLTADGEPTRCSACCRALRGVQRERLRASRCPPGARRSPTGRCCRRSGSASAPGACSSTPRSAATRCSTGSRTTRRRARRASSRQQLDEKLDGWQELGRRLCRAFLAEAAQARSAARRGATTRATSRRSCARRSRAHGSACAAVAEREPLWQYATTSVPGSSAELLVELLGASAPSAGRRRGSARRGCGPAAGRTAGRRVPSYSCGVRTSTSRHLAEPLRQLVDRDVAHSDPHELDLGGDRRAPLELGEPVRDARGQRRRRACRARGSPTARRRCPRRGSARPRAPRSSRASSFGSPRRNA